MTWDPRAPEGNESYKVRFDVLEFVGKGGMDIGCGRKKVWPHLIGIDDRSDRIRYGLDVKCDAVIDASNVGKLYAEFSAPCVFSSHLLEHIEDYRRALKAWWKLVEINGTLVLYLPHKDHYPRIGETGSNPDHKHDFDNAEIEAAMRELAPDWTLVVDEVRTQDLEYSFLQVYRKEPPGTGQATRLRVRPPKSAGVVRVGAYGDSLWGSSVAAHLKEQGYHVTMYAAFTGADLLRYDPNIDRIVELPDGVMDDDDLLGYYAYMSTKHDRWINLIGSVEDRLLVHPSSVMFYQPQQLRHKLMNTNYLEMIHDYADLPHDFRQKFYPAPHELKWAEGMLAKLREQAPGPVVVLNPGGSGLVKWWPHSQRLMQLFANAGIYTVLLGKLYDGDLEPVEPWAHVVGMEWPVRMALTFAQLADAVVATESLIVNAVAFEPMLKVVTLSHSSNENLTKHWVNTAAIEATKVPCHPCHRVHPNESYAFCSQDKASGAAACLAYASADMIAEFVIDHFQTKGLLPARAPVTLDAAPLREAA
jgi:predicted SAM-dependent methyltransferase